MTVVVSNWPTTINTANWFYRCESWNMNFLGGIWQVTATTVACHLAVTFANACNIKWIWLWIGSISANQNRWMRVNLAENLWAFTVNIASPWVFTKTAHWLNDLDEVFLDTTWALPTGLNKKTARYYVRNKTDNTFNLSTTPTWSLVNTSWTQSWTHSIRVARIRQSYTVAEILPANVNINDSAYAYTAVPFEFTTPYAVDTTANKWRFIFWQELGTAWTYYFLVSDWVVSENFCHFAWWDTAVSFTDDDVLICKDRVTVDKSFRIKWVLWVWNTVYSVAWLVCRSLNKWVNDISNLVWENTPSASYKMTINWWLVIWSFAWIQIGSETNPIPASVKAVVEFVAPTVWTDISCIRGMYYSSTSRPIGKHAYIFYWEVPTYRYWTLASTANISQNKIVLTEDMSAIWNVWDVLAVWKQNVKWQWAVGTYIIASFNGPEITLTSNILTNARLVWWTVINRSRGYGIEMKSDTDWTRYHYIMSNAPIHARVSWVNFTNVYFASTLYATTQQYEDISTTKPYYCDNLARFTQTSAASLFAVWAISRMWVDIKRNLCWRWNVLYNVWAIYVSILKSWLLTVEDNIILSNYSANAWTLASNNYKIVYKNNRRENTYYSAMILYWKNPLIEWNLFWGGSSTQPTVAFWTFCLNPLFKNNTFDGNFYAIWYWTSWFVVNWIMQNDSFWQEVLNSSDFYIPISCLWDIVIQSPTWTLNIPTTYLADTINWFKLRIVDENNVANVDRMYLTEWYYMRCWDWLADTTVHTAWTGKFSLRMEALNEPLLREQKVPTGNIQWKTMTVSVWAKINSENYWSWIYVLPRLTINYDGWTIAYAQASNTTERQQIFVTFTPTTTTWELTITFSTETDQSWADCYVYLDDMNIAYPAWYALDLWWLDIRSWATPVTPSIATFPSLWWVRDELKASHSVTWSFGEEVKNLFPLLS